jgi:GT2 family glycosyltransferase/exopolysaccharide biosynthesis predicted pyruvyltransferase EpsI
MGLPGSTEFLTGHGTRLAASRAALLEEIGDGHDLTFVTAEGNLGDKLIAAGTRELLSGRIYREIFIDELAKSSGEIALLIGTGGWCRPYHDCMPRALAIAELRFERVIVLPSSFDVTEDVVREALERSKATVFAREHESLARIEGMCDARLAHDCAFFFDFSGFTASGSGTLNAFRSDHEAPLGSLDLGDNDDVSVTASDLDDWLATIERHEHVRTDRAHVMIAAALMGKTVEYSLGSYFKVGALADSWLGEFPVTRIDAPRRPRPAPDAAADLKARLRATAGGAKDGHPVLGEQVTAVIVTRDRVELTRAAIASVLDDGDATRVLLIGNNPSDQSRERLGQLAEADPRIELRILDRNLGCAGARQLASELVETEQVLFLDDDCELIEGALGRLRADLAEHADAVGVTALVVGADGLVQHCGGTAEHSAEIARFLLGGNGLRYDDPAVPATGHSDWLPGGAALIRTAVLREIPIDAALAHYYEDNDWSLRLERVHPGRLRRCREAVVLHHGPHTRVSASPEIARVFDTIDLLRSQAVFLARNGVVLDVDLVALLPELRLQDAPGPDIAAVRLLLALVAAHDVAWVANEWLSGGLEPLLEPNRREKAHLAALELRDAKLAHMTDAHGELAGYVEILRREIAEQTDKVNWLLTRHETLVRVEQGRYMRMKSRLAPAIGLARRTIAEARSRWS